MTHKPSQPAQAPTTSPAGWVEQARQLRDDIMRAVEDHEERAVRERRDRLQDERDARHREQ